MSEERKMILKMVEEGKITPEQGVELLKAVKDETKNEEEKRSTVGDQIKRELDESFKEANSELRSSLSEAKIIGKEALKTLKESVQQALEESKQAIKESGVSLSSEKMDELSEVDEELAKEWKKAEEDFSYAKKKFNQVERLKEEIVSIEEQISSLNEKGNPEEVELRQELKKHLVELSGKKERMLEEARQVASVAEEKMIAVRKKAKEQGVSLESAPSEKPSGESTDLEEIITKATSQIGPLVTSIMESFSFGGDGHLVVEKFDWVPDSEDENVVINTNLQNGSVKIYQDDDIEQIHVKLNKRVKADKERVSEIAKNLVKVKQAGNIISIEVEKRFSNRHSVSAEIYLPEKYKYDCNLKSVNGSITLEEVVGDAFLISTTNGKIVIKDSAAKIIQAGSTNGSIRCEASAKKVDLRTSNGSIRHFITEKTKGEMNLSTVNGSVRVYLESDECASVVAKSKVGSIKLDGEWIILRQIKGRVGNDLVAHQKGCDLETADIKITATTSQGSIKIIEE